MVSEFVDACTTAVRRAGDVLRERFGRARVRYKGRADLVTDADLAAQDIVRQTLCQLFPTHALIGEEDPPDGPRPPQDSEFRWIVDPLDGTTNYAHGVPFFSVSLALEHRGRILVGAVYNPVSDELFCAEAGKGATLNGCPIRVSHVTSLSDAVVAGGFPPGVTRDAPDLRMFNEVVVRSQSIRRTGSASLNLAFVAAGRFDAVWSYATKVWDVTAGALLIQEAGGVATGFGGEPICGRSGRVVAAATPALHAELLAVARQLGIA